MTGDHPVGCAPTAARWLLRINVGRASSAEEEDEEEEDEEEEDEEDDDDEDDENDEAQRGGGAEAHEQRGARGRTPSLANLAWS